jgi:hypothetical protein
MTMTNDNMKVKKYSAKNKGVNAGLMPTTSPEKIRKMTAKANHKACMHGKKY